MLNKTENCLILHVLYIKIQLLGNHLVKLLTISVKCTLPLHKILNVPTNMSKLLSNFIFQGYNLMMP